MPLPTIIDRIRPMAEKRKGWVKKATENAHGQFKAKVEKAGESTKTFAKQHEHDKDKTGAQARLAMTLMGMKRKKMYDHPSSGKK